MSMVMYLKDKAQVEKILAKSFIKVERESTTTPIWEKKEIKEQKYFNC